MSKSKGVEIQDLTKKRYYLSVEESYRLKTLDKLHVLHSSPVVLGFFFLILLILGVICMHENGWGGFICVIR